MIRNVLAIIGKLLHKNKTVELYKSAYENIAPHYDQCVTRQTLAKETSQTIDKLILKPGLRCLDLGCGTGHATRLVDNKVAPNGTVFAYDISQAMLDVAKAKNHDLMVTKFIQKDMLTALLDHPDNSVDLVCSFWAMEYNSDITRTLKEIERVLTPKGQVAILINTQESLPEAQKIITKVFIKNMFALRTIPPVWVPKSLNNFSHMVHKAGLQALDVSEQSTVHNFQTGAQLVNWIRTGGPCAGFNYFLKKKYEDHIFEKIAEEIDNQQGTEVTFKFIRFIGYKK